MELTQVEKIQLKNFIKEPKCYNFKNESYLHASSYTMFVVCQEEICHWYDAKLTQDLEINAELKNIIDLSSKMFLMIETTK